MNTQDKRPFWRQPLFHFLVLGAAIFALNALRGGAVDPASQKIVVSVNQVERMAGLWQKTWGRPPSETELQALVRDHIKEEIYYRESLRLGLDNNDTVIRRRLRQKMEFLTASEVTASAPTDDDLKTFYQANADKYRQSPVFTFDQIYFKTENTDASKAALIALRKGETYTGDIISLPANLSQADEADIARVFGSSFYEAIDNAPVGEWTGPIKSGFGVHVIMISEKLPAKLPDLAVVRKKIENDYLAREEKAARDAGFEKLRAKYKVEIETP